MGETPRKSVTSPARALFPHDVNKAAHRRVTPSTPITTDKKTLSPSIVNKVRLVTPTSPPRTRTISTPPKIRNTTSSNNANPTSRVHVRTRTVSATSAASPHLKVSGAIIRPATVVGREPLSTPLVRKVSGQLHTKTSTPPKSPLGLFVRSKPNDPLDNPGEFTFEADFLCI